MAHVLESTVHEPDYVTAYQRDGAVCLRGVFADWVEMLRQGVARNMREPGPHASENTRSGEPGRFFDDYCNWKRIPEFRDFVAGSPLARIAAQAMRSQTARFFHDHVLVKEPGTLKETPWHQDSPYYFVDGGQTVSFWLPLDPVSKQTTLRFIKGSHLWEKQILPIRWLSEASFYGSDEDYLPIPDPDAEPRKYEVLEWAMAPGDAVLFSFSTAHGARGNETGARRRAASFRLVGDDARYGQRLGATSPPYPGHDMKPGQRLREDWFPVIWPQSA